MIPLVPKGYSLYVNLMRVFLPVGIVLSVGFAIGWPYIHSLGQDKLPRIDTSQPDILEKRMVRPHYMSTDDKGQPFHVAADWAKQKTENVADLTNPRGSMTVNDGQTFDLEAKKGHYNSETKVLNLEEDVKLTSTDGYNVQTEQASITIDNKVIEGDRYIEGTGPTGEIMGQKGFKVETLDHGKKRITLKGQSRVIINKTVKSHLHKKTHVE